MKSFILIIFSVLAFSGQSFAVTGGVDGGGGKGVVCRDSQGKIVKAEMLDLYEGRAQYGISYQESKVSWKDQSYKILASSELFGPVMPPSDDSDPNTAVSIPYSSDPNAIINTYQTVINHLVFLPSDVVLKPIDDSLEVIAPRNCEIEQVANYQSDTRILVNGEIWNAFSETQKSALVIHEAVYRHLRAYGETNSKRSRHFNAYLFNGGKVEDTFPGNDYKTICMGADRGLGLYLVQVPNDEYGNPMLRAQFYNLSGRKLMTKSYVDFSGVVGLGEHSDNFVPLLDALKSSNGGLEVINQNLVTKSLFEEGDNITLRLKKGASGKIQIEAEGTSSVDGSFFKAQAECSI